jgi:hypothetical protein
VICGVEPNQPIELGMRWRIIPQYEVVEMTVVGFRRRLESGGHHEHVFGVTQPRANMDL